MLPENLWPHKWFRRQKSWGRLRRGTLEMSLGLGHHNRMVLRLTPAFRSGICLAR